MKIKSIKISKIRGIDELSVELNMIPNKPSLLVAPNGSGKTSFATAFESMNGNRMIGCMCPNSRVDRIVLLLFSTNS